MDHGKLIEENFLTCCKYVEKAFTACKDIIEKVIDESISVLENGGTLYFAGNGGSAADSSHIASELVGAYEGLHAPLPALAFTTDVCILTSVSNDFSFDCVFLQQVQALVRPGDQLWLISTSGESINLCTAAEWAKTYGIATVGLLGKGGGRLAKIVDFPIIVPGDETQRIQEVHILILHTLASALKRHFPNGVTPRKRLV